jgi:hypothetical protein
LSYDQTFTFNQLPRTQADTMHWRTRARYRKLWHREIDYEVMRKRAKPSTPLPHARIECTRFSSHQPDFDNLGNSFKPLIDGLVKSFVIEDDSPAHVEVEYKWEHVAPKQGYVVMRVTDDLEPPPASGLLPE